MNCDEAEELLGAYALDALPAVEAGQVRAHLTGCARHAHLAVELRLSAAQLALTADPETPPAELRARILRSLAAVPQVAGRSQGAATAERELRLRWRNRAMAWRGLAAAAVVAIFGLLAWNIVLQTRDDSPSLARLAEGATAVVPLEASGAEGRGVVVYYAERGEALIVGRGMERLDPARATYQIWAIDEGTPRSLGLMETGRDGSALRVVPFDAREEQMIAITVEPPGGSAQPTSDPIFSAGL